MKFHIAIVCAVTFLMSSTFSFADKNLHQKAYNEIIEKTSRFTTAIVGGCKKSNYHETLKSTYRKAQKPKVLYACIDWRNSSLGHIEIQSTSHTCGKYKGGIKKLIKISHAKCIHGAIIGTSCRCTLIDVNGKNALPRRLVEKYLK